MKRIYGIVASLCIAILAAAVTHSDAAGVVYAVSPPAPAGQTGEAFLHSIYDRYVGPEDKTHPIDYASTRELRRYFERSLAATIDKDFIRAKKVDEVPTLDGDPFVDAQEWDIKSFDIQVTPADANHATGVVKFDNEGSAKVLHVQLVRIAGAWKIHDIDYGGGEGTLTGLFKAGGAPGK